MSLLEQIEQQIRQLPPEKQSEVLDFAVFLQQRPEFPQLVSFCRETHANRYFNILEAKPLECGSEAAAFASLI
jgi:hypothetical protein